MYRPIVLLVVLMCTCEAQLPKKYLHVKGVYKCNFKPISGESVVILHRSTPVFQHPVPDWWEKIAEINTDEQGNYELQASDDVCTVTDGCAGSGEKGFYVQLTHHCFEDRKPHKLTIKIPEENQGDSENEVKLFKHDFDIIHERKCKAP